MARGEKAALTPESYYSAQWFEREQESVFRRNWLYGGTLSELSADNSWVNKTYGSRSWIITRSAEKLNCYRNVCSHRHSRIVSAGKGCGPLRCGYHGWTYGSDGIPTGLPGQRDNFDLTEGERAALRLPQGEAMAIGNFVFFRDMASSCSAKRDICDAAKSLLQNLSLTFTTPFESFSQTWRANWKAGVENTLEPYHAGFVHAESLAQVLDTTVSEKTLTATFSALRHKLKARSNAWWQQMTSLTGITPSRDLDDYQHFFIYPNICIGVTFGCLLSIQTFVPISSEVLTIDSFLFLPSIAPEDAEKSIYRTMKDFLIEYNRKLLDEDRIPVESSQSGFRDAVGHAILGESEDRIGYFQRSILDDMSAT
jgi:choline monooxygenase